MTIHTRALLCAVAALLTLQTLTSHAYATFGKWLLSPLVIYINPQNSDVTAAAAEAALLAGMNVWNTDGRANVSFSYAGRVNDTNVGFDSRNVVIFRNADAGSTIAATYTWSSAGSIVDADVVFFDAPFTFLTGSGACSGGVFIEDIAAHEFGHVLGLNHSADPSATMALGYPACSQEFRTLAPDDIAGVQSLYGVAATANTAPTVTIASPASGSSVTFGNAITFLGSASDAQDGNLSSRLQWTSTLDGAIGSGASFTRTLSAGIHVIAASVTDNGGLIRSTSVTISITTSSPSPPPPSGGTNVALASAGAVASASSTYAAGYAASAAINGQRSGAGWGNGGGWDSATPGHFPEFVQVDFAASYSISQVNVFSVQDNFTSPIEPTSTQTFTAYGVTSFEVQYWTGTAWVTIPGTTVAGNNLVWRTVTFTPVTTQKIRVVVNGSPDGYSRLTEVEAYTGGTPPSPPPPSGGTNVALASAGAVASASSTYAAGYAASAAINGQRSGAGWGNGGGWASATPGHFPEFVQVDFAASYSISQVNVFSVQDNFTSPIEPTSTQTFTAFGVTSFEVQYWTGAGWVTIPGTTVTGNNRVWRTVTFTPVTTQKIRVVVNGSADGYSRLTEVEAFATGASQPVTYTYHIVNQYPHDTGAFTQGLELHNNVLYESTGLNGSSTLRQVDLQSGAVLRRVDVPAQYFAEGLTVFLGKIFQLTWQSGVGFIYDLTTFAKTGQFTYAGEGWGLTHDAQHLIMSDGTNQIRFVDPVSFQTVRSISVLDSQSVPVTRINELEYVNGEIYANIWQTDLIARIDPASGRITAWIDLRGLLPSGTSADVLNGIAFDQASGHLLVTGKLWPWLFEIALVPVI